MTNHDELPIPEETPKGVDVVLYFSEVDVETSRADWITTELEKQGFRVAKHQYKPGNISPAQSRARLIILFSTSTPEWVTEQYFLWGMAGQRPLPVKVEACRPPSLMAGLRFANIFGENESQDKQELQKLVEAIVS